MKRTLLSLAAAGLFAAAGSASSATISFTFQPCGNNTCAVTADKFDWQPGNVLAQNGAGGAGGITPGKIVDNLYQANLTAIQLGNTNVFNNGTGNVFFTVVAGFKEVAIAGGLSAVFQVIPGAPNYFEVYRNTVGTGSDLAGTGFTTGDLVLSGSIVSGFSTTAATSFVACSPGPFCIVANAPLDNYNGDGSGNNYPGVTTISTVGGSDITAVLSFIDPTYFPDLQIADTIVTALTASNLGTPFNQTNPSAQFYNGGGLVPSNIGTQNGITGPNFQFQADASTTFTRQAVPEPGSLALLGLALMGAAGAVRRRRSA